MKTKLLTALAVMLVAVMTASASSKVTADSVMDRVLEKMESAPSMSVTMTLRNGDSAVAGNLTFARDKFRFTSGEVTVYYDGKTQWTLDSDAGEVSVTSPTAEEIIETNPLAFMRNYRKRYDVRLVSSASGVYVVRMTARTKSTYVRTAEVTVNASTMMPVTVSALLSTGQHLQINIVSTSKGKTLPLSTFRFDATRNRGIEVIDLR